jgi:hypothetical protein
MPSSARAANCSINWAGLNVPSLPSRVNVSEWSVVFSMAS